MAILGWAPFADLPDDQKPRFVGNASGRFESRFTTVEIMPSPAIMFAGMEGSRLGVWVAHGEGRAHIPEPETKEEILRQNLAPLRFVTPDGGATTQYPFNPNGSADGITGFCSPDGRHLAIMPHPERSANALWQWPWLPEEWQKLEASPWLRMFQNAKDWCDTVE
jgi:phosphoribosylformylglycinamidine synthase